MLEAVKRNTKLGTVGEVSPVLVGLYHLFFFLAGGGSEKTTALMFQVSYCQLSFSLTM